jgi:hypothetical protein
MPPPCGVAFHKEVMRNNERSEPINKRREAAREKKSIFAYRLFAIYTILNIALLLYRNYGFRQMAKIYQLYLIMQYIDFYERVKALVKSKKTTIGYVVGEAGLSLASYNAYRRHENLPRADEALKIAQVLGTTVEYLLTGDIPKSSASDEALVKIQLILNEYMKIER